MDHHSAPGLPKFAGAFLDDFRRRANVVREIQSGLAQTKRRWDIAHTILVVVLGAAITFLGFMGPDRILDAWPNVAVVPGALPNKGVVDGKIPADVSPPTPSSASTMLSLGNPSSTKKTFDLLFNVVTLALFITSLLNLIYRWKEEHYAHFQGVVKLTQYLHWLDEIELNASTTYSPRTLTEVRLKYQIIAETLLPNSDSDYRKAKKRLKQKASANDIRVRPTMLPDSDDDSMSAELLLTNAILACPMHMHILAIARVVRADLWLGGGAIRSLVWDTLAGCATKYDDFDLVYFDKSALGEAADKELEQEIALRFRDNAPDPIRISVSNQARMHLITHEPARMSLQEALANWPETATCVAVRLNEAGILEILAPHGLNDLVNMVVRPTPYHKLHSQSFEARKNKKQWDQTWTQVRYEG